MIDDATLLTRFDSCTLDDFPHAAHVRVAFLMLRAAPLPDALTRFARGLQRFAAAKGVPGKYHETLTWAFMLLIHERMARAAAVLAWPEFIAAHPELLDKSIIDRYYTAATLASPLARRTFVMPDRVAPAAGATCPAA